MNKKKRDEVLTQLGLAQAYTSEGDVERAERCCDTAIRTMHSMGTHGMTLRELNAACDAFLEETGFPTLAVASIYISSYREADEKRGNPDPTDAPKDSAAGWCEVMTILGSYAADGFRMPVHCEHDTIWICVPANAVNAEHIKRLSELGWEPGRDGFWSFQSA